ncbi:MAG: hypothetical protein LBG21_05555 [Campylobacteraceae bacterium]|jgi:uncharacterized lipoprotein NlpE involved in copper resistance|nr:hypothetical protein [Campylobacteraceae bacterium]
MFKKIFMLVAVIILLMGCNSGSSDSNTSQNGEKPSDELPTLDRTDSLAGIDENQNGIRDDIEKYIIENYPDEVHKKALFQFAKTMQEELLVDVSDMIAVKKLSIKSSRAMHCIFLKFDVKKGDENPSIAWKKIRSMTTNTKVRLQTYLKYNKALDGTALSLPRGDTCE